MKFKKWILVISAILLTVNVQNITAIENTSDTSVETQHKGVSESVEIPAVLIDNAGLAEFDYDNCHHKIGGYKLYIKKNSNGNYKVYVDDKDVDIKSTFSFIVQNISQYFANDILSQNGCLHINIMSDRNIRIYTDPITVYNGLMDYRYTYAFYEITLYLSDNEPEDKQNHPSANIYDYRTGKLIWHKDIYKENLTGDYNRNDPASLDKFYNELEKKCR